MSGKTSAAGSASSHASAHIGSNKKARFDYSIEETIECGVALEGTEVKSVKNGNVSFPDAFAEITGGEVWLKGFHIAEYPFSSIFNHDPLRHKKLLLHAAEIKRLARKTQEKGFTLIPLEFYLKKGRLKVLLGLCKGKKQYDKRESIKDRDVKREIARDFKNALR
ncbi:MAG: SsrA-binding protein SmpB [Treponemataceae bacterium]|nr:MAG: SsrA-binding protein SmpB [Treponemataceae bacterium]